MSNSAFRSTSRSYLWFLPWSSLGYLAGKQATWLNAAISDTLKWFESNRQKIADFARYPLDITQWIEQTRSVCGCIADHLSVNNVPVIKPMTGQFLRSAHSKEFSPLKTKSTKKNLNNFMISTIWCWTVHGSARISVRVNKATRRGS